MTACPATHEAVAELEAAGDTGCTICGRSAVDHAPERPAPAHPFIPRLANQPWGLCWCGLAESAHADTVTPYTALISRRGDASRDRVERLKRERAERCRRGQHDDPDHTGACILCGADLEADPRREDPAP